MTPTFTERTFRPFLTDSTVSPDGTLLARSRAWWDGSSVMFETRLSQRRKRKGRLQAVETVTNTTVHYVRDKTDGGKTKCARFVLGLHDAFAAEAFVPR